MIQTAEDMYLFCLGRSAYKRIGTRGWLLFNAFLICAFVSVLLGALLLPTYLHTFTPYLKWQDALVALCWFITFISLGGCVLVGRFLYALRAGYREGMLTLVGSSTLVVRDLSHENLASIFWMVGTALSCFLAALLGLVPIMLIGWTLQLPHPALAVLGTALAVALGAAGCVLAAIAITFVLIGCVGSVSYCRKMASLQTYQLTNQTTLMIDDFVLTIMAPGKPESVVELDLLDADDQRHLLHLLRKHWIDTPGLWNPEEVEVTLRETKR